MSKQHTKTIEIIVRNIKKLRQINGFSQSELGKLAGIDPSYISRVEKADRKLSLETVEKIAEAFGIKPYELLKPHTPEEMNLRDMLQEISNLPDLQQMMVRQMISSFIKEKNNKYRLNKT